MSQKIDWTTFGNIPIGGTNGMPVARTTVTYTSMRIPVQYTRIGNLVTATIGQDNLGSFPPEYTVVGNTPNGFTPYASTVIVCGGYNSTDGGSASFNFVLRQNKEVAFATGGWSGTMAFIGAATYITNDAFPSP